MKPPPWTLVRGKEAEITIPQEARDPLIPQYIFTPSRDWGKGGKDWGGVGRRGKRRLERTGEKVQFWRREIKEAVRKRGVRDEEGEEREGKKGERKRG